MKRSYNIVTACDDNFAQHTTVMLASLFSHHQECSFQVFILVPSDFLEETAAKITASFTTNVRLKIIRVSDDAVSELKVDGHVTKAAYFRLRIDELLPAALQRVLYLDPDIIVTGDVTELFETDLLDFPFGAVPDLFIEVYRKDILSKIELSEGAHYFNSGVLLIDLPRWRSLNIGARAITYCRSNRDAITFWDQCALNHAANGQFYVLDQKWNFQAYSVFQTESSARLHSAKIVHFTGKLKPWHFLCTHPLKHLYFELLRTTAWTDFKVHWTHRDLIKRILGPTMSRAAVAAARRIRIWPGP